jgi:hypothetical protein
MACEDLSLFSYEILGLVGRGWTCRHGRPEMSRSPILYEPVG